MENFSVFFEKILILPELNLPVLYALHPRSIALTRIRSHFFYLACHLPSMMWWCGIVTLCRCCSRLAHKINLIATHTTWSINSLTPFAMNTSLWLSAIFTTTAFSGAVAGYETISDNYDCFRSMDGMMESMEDLANEHPDHCLLNPWGGGTCGQHRQSDSNQAEQAEFFEHTGVQHGNRGGRCRICRGCPTVEREEADQGAKADEE